VTASAARVTAHAKINLSLRILAREQSGFHTIETLFSRIALGDEVLVRVRAAGRELAVREVDCRGADVGPPERNLAFRAALAFADAVGWPSGFRIEIEKRIPAGGGLGGGSADAGAVLRALAALAPRPVPEHELLRIAMTLGSDVPFLTSSSPLALAWGRGERMLALPPLPERPVLLIAPDFPVSTGDAYSWVAADRGDLPPAPHLLLPEQLESWSGVAAIATNDFEPPVARRHPEITMLLDALRDAGATIARLSGSGSTVYGVFDGEPAPADAFPRELPGTLVRTRTLRRIHPVTLCD
jgi:4-diphosphocytidyl-2-C-methyl-D-erythritol kinase